MHLVTGGAGFIGSVLIKELNHRGIKNIILVDRLRSTQKWKNLSGLCFTDFIHADDFLAQNHLKSFKNLDAIWHLGACSSTTETDVDYLMKNNVQYSQELFTWATMKNVPILYASSAATYGNGSQGYSDAHEGVRNLRPLNPYGFSKQLVDEWALAQKVHPDIWMGVKFFNVYGPNEYHKTQMCSMAYRGHQQLKDKGVIRLFKSYQQEYADGGQLRDFIYVRDAALACIEMMEKQIKKPKKTMNGIYNLGTGKARSFNDLAKSIFDALGLPPRIEYFDMPEGLPAQYQYYTQAEMKKFKTLLPSFKFHSLEEGIKDYVLNYLEKVSPYYANH